MNIATKIVLSIGTVILFIPGLVIEPGPISEIAALGILTSIWGIDWNGGE